MFELHEVIFEIYIEDELVNRQPTKASKQMLISTFLQTVQQIVQDQRPMKIKMVKPDIIWDKFEWKQKTINNEVCFINNAMISWEEKHNKS